MNRFALKENLPSILVSTLSAAFGVSLLQVTSNLAVMINADDTTGSSSTVALMLAIVALVFIVIATYVGAIVTANTFATIIAGRTRTIAFMRLIGSTAKNQRRTVARHGVVVGVIGAVLGMLTGTALTWGLVNVTVAIGVIPDLNYVYLEPVILIPILGVVMTTWLASWVGSRKVLDVSPIQATGASVAVTHAEATARRGRNAVAVTLFCLGGALLVGGAVVGLVSPAGVLIGVGGGILSFTGLVLGAGLVMPPALRLVGKMLGTSASGRLAAENAVRYPERSARTTIGLVIGVTLVTMFAVAAATFQKMLTLLGEAADIEGLIAVIVTIFSVLIGFSALIAAVGMVNNLSLSVLQRTRELGLLRALGFTSRQLRGMIRAESAQLTIAAVLVGLVLGVFYGWAGAQALLGSVPGSGGLVLPVVPLWLVGVVVVVSALLTFAASAAPARRATRVSPVTALAVD